MCVSIYTGYISCIIIGSGIQYLSLMRQITKPQYKQTLIFFLSNPNFTMDVHDVDTKRLISQKGSV